MSGEHNRAALGALALVLAVALAVRLWGVGWQLPWQFHPDEGHYTWKAVDMLGEGGLNPRYFRNPTLFTYLLYGEYRLLGFQPPKADGEAASSDGILRPPSGVAFVGRLNSALMGSATVAALAWIGWRLLGPWTGVIAAAFLGLAFIHVRDSHYATNDVPTTLLLVLSVAGSLELVRRPTARAYFLAGLLGGLATSTKYNAGLFFAPLVVAHALSLTGAHTLSTRHPSSPHPNLLPGGEGMNPLSPWEKAKDAGSPTSASRVRARETARNAGQRVHLLATALVTAAVAFVAGTPYSLLTFDKFWADFRTQMRLGGEGWEGQVPSPSGVLYLEALGHGVGWLMLALALVGLLLLARRRPRDAAVIAAFPIAYLLFMLRTELFFVRFALPLVPFLCLLAACGTVLLTHAVEKATAAGQAAPGRIPPHRIIRTIPIAGALGVAMTVVALIQPTLGVVRHNALIGQDDTRVLAARWALANIPPTAKVAVEEYSIRDRRPRAYGGSSWQLDTDLFNVNDVRAADPARSLGAYDYFVVSSFQYERFRGDGPRFTRQSAFYAELEREGRLVAQFAPGRGGSSLRFDLEDLYTPFWELGRYERPGPTIKIYAVGPG